MKRWYDQWPERLQREQYEMQSRFPGFTLRRLDVERLAWVGPVHTSRGQSYTIAIEYPHDFPQSSPRVYPIDADFEGDFTKTPHRLADGSLCLAYPAFNSPLATAADIVGAAKAWLEAFERFVETGRWAGSEYVGYSVRTATSERRRRVFISYSHADSRWLKRLRVHLKPLEDAGVLDVWDDTRILAGASWRAEIQEALDHAIVAVLLVSADFLASDFVRETELPVLLRRAESDGATVLPVIVSPSRFTKHPTLSRFQAINPPSRPLSFMNRHDQEELLVKVANAVEFAVECGQALDKLRRTGQIRHD